MVQINNKSKGMILIAIALLFLIYLPFVFAEDNWPPKKDLTIQQFLVDMKAHPQNYYVIINRSQEEINILMNSTSLSSLLNTFNVEVSSYFKDNCKNFLLIEIPTTELGQLFGLQRANSYIQIYQNSFLMDQPYEYYLANNVCSFNYTIIYLYPQTLAFDFSSEEKTKESNIKIAKVDKDGNGALDLKELATYYLDNIIDRVDNYTKDPINARTVVVNENNDIIDLPIGKEDYCIGYDSNNTIFRNYTYHLPSLDMSESCINSTAVNELICTDGGSVKYEVTNCPQGFHCSHAECTANYIGPNNIFTLILRFIMGNINLNDIIRELSLWTSN
jgi:hypothetical protein